MRVTTPSRLIFSAVCATGMSAICNGQCESDILQDPTQASQTFFGRSIGLDGNLLVVGASHAPNPAGRQVGGLYIYDVNVDGATFVQAIHPSEGALSDWFASSLAVHGDLIVAGVPGWNESSGRVFVFRNVDGSWTEEAVLSPADAIAHDEFGRSVAANDAMIVVGAPQPHTEGSQPGAVYVFRRIDGQWIQDARLLASDGDDDDRFGTSVSCDASGLIVIGAVFDRVLDPLSNNGSAYVFRYDEPAGQWLEEQKLTASDVDSGFISLFGSSVDVHGTTAVVTSGRSFPGPTQVAYVYERTEGVWLETAILEASPDTSSLIWPARTVSFHGNRITLGAYFDDTGGEDAGAIGVFERADDTWQLENVLYTCTPKSEAWLGWSVAASESFVAASAPGDLLTETPDGSVFVFPRQCPSIPGDITNDGVVDILDLLHLLVAWGPCTGCLADVNSDGMVDVLDLFVLLANWGHGCR